MAVLAIFTGTGITKQMYEALRPEVRWETNRPAGMLFHASAFDESGDIHVADVWESVETMNEFVSNRLIPAMKKLGVPPPSVSVFPAHNINVYPAAQKFFLK
ncbi:MAG: hypothetical protein ACREV9_10700 [Burkholderiales bacterium]